MATSRPRKATALREAMTKTQLVASLSESTGLPKKDVAAVLDELGVLIERHIKKRAVGTFTLPGTNTSGPPPSGTTKPYPLAAS